VIWIWWNNIKNLHKLIKKLLYKILRWMNKSFKTNQNKILKFWIQLIMKILINYKWMSKINLWTLMKKLREKATFWSQAKKAIKDQLWLQVNRWYFKKITLKFKKLKVKNKVIIFIKYYLNFYYYICIILTKFNLIFRNIRHISFK